MSDGMSSKPLGLYSGTVISYNTTVLTAYVLADLSAVIDGIHVTCDYFNSSVAKTIVTCSNKFALIPLGAFYCVDFLNYQALLDCLDGNGV